jgi:hypothetical protein
MDYLLTHVVEADDMAGMVRHKRIGLLPPRLVGILGIHGIDL